MRFTFIHRERTLFPITALCRVLRVSCSGYHAWVGRAPSARKTEDRLLAVEIAAAFVRSRKTYGSPRIRVELSSRGTHAGRHRIAPNVLERSFSTAAPNRAWVSDVKAIRTGEGWLYLAAVIDLFSRRVVGHAMSASNDTTLALQALNNAKAARGHTSNLVHHSDRGSPSGSDIDSERLVSFHMRPWAGIHSQRTAKHIAPSVSTSTSFSTQSGGIQQNE